MATHVAHLRCPTFWENRGLCLTVHGRYNFGRLFSREYNPIRCLLFGVGIGAAASLRSGFVALNGSYLDHKQVGNLVSPFDLRSAVPRNHAITLFTTEWQTCPVRQLLEALGTHARTKVLLCFKSRILDLIHGLGFSGVIEWLPL